MQSTSATPAKRHHKPQEITLHPHTKRSIDRYVSAPTQVLCLIGPPGAGKRFMANYIVNTVLSGHHESSVHVISAENGIGIEQVRSLQRFLRLKMPGKSGWRRAVIIEDAAMMSAEAQNALLKTLEEPPEDAIFILTADTAASLKPTVRSRLQTLNILPLSLEQAHDNFGKHESVTKAYHMSGGFVGLMYALLNQPQHPLVEGVQKAKSLLRASPYERLSGIESLSKDRQQLLLLLYALRLVMAAALNRQTHTASTSRLVKSLRLIYAAEADLRLSGNPKLILTDLFLSL